MENSNNNEDTIENVKRQAFDALVPLVDQIEGEPEQKFGVIMNALRVSHNDALLQKAFDIAQQIPDTGIRAEALIDIINEANYQSTL